MMSTNNTLRWQIDSDEHKIAKAKMKLAGKLLDAWVSDGIKIEIEDCTDAKEAYDFIKKGYAVTMERARDGLLNQLNELKLDDYPSSHFRVYLDVEALVCHFPSWRDCPGPVSSQMEYVPNSQSGNS